MNKNKTWTEIKADWYFKKEGFQENNKTEFYICLYCIQKINGNMVKNMHRMPN